MNRAMEAFFLFRVILFFGALIGGLIWLTTLPYPLDLLVGCVGSLLAIGIINLRTPGADFMAMGSLAAVYAVVEGVLR